MQLMNLKLTTLLAMGLILGLGACGEGDEDQADASVASVDAGAQAPDRGVYMPPDAGQTNNPTDSGVNSGRRDAGHYCAPSTGISVDGTDVEVNEANEIINSTAVVNCIDEPPPRDIPGSITIRLCVNLIGTGTTASQSELDELEIAIFYDKNVATGMDVDPTFTASTGVDREPASRVDTDINQIENANCPSGIEFELGRRSLGGNAVKAAIDYTIRLSSKTSSGAWATMYHDRSKVFADRIVGGGGAPSNCDPTNCTGILNVFAVRKADVAQFVASSGASIDGADDLTDGVGEGHALIASNDCQLTAMSNSVAGFEPKPKGGAYLVAGNYDSTAKATDESGLYIGLGFGSETEVTAAVGIMRDANTCTEEFAGHKINVYPDAITVFGSSPANTLNQN